MAVPHRPAAAQPGTAVPAEPTTPVRFPWILGVVLVNVGINVAFFGPLQVLLAQQAAAFDPGRKEAIFALVTGAGAAVSMIGNPLAGALSDRTPGRFGRRRPWVLFGAVGGAIGLVALAGAPDVAVMTALWCLVQAGCNAAYAAITAAIPDKVPVTQRGTVGGLASMGITVGILLGAVVAAVVAGSFSLGYVVCAAVLVLGTVVYLVSAGDAALPRGAFRRFSLPAFLGSFWISPRRHPDFAWAWFTKLLVNVGNHMILLYLVYFLTDEVRIEQTTGIAPATGVLILTGIYAVLVIVTSVVGGRLSDRMGRRKPLVILSSCVIAAASLTIGLFPTWAGAIAGASVLGIGYGAYQAVDFALVTQVLPRAEDRGKDLGVINVANSLPQVIAPAIAYPFVAFLGGYVSLYIAAAVIGLLGAVFVTRIRSVA
ncbi:MFS transporter [Sinomonas atrocyanea]|uniref:MFS transporter n=1 Tax=Sinomonas atrocyanea TaxID=37927 RepID=A0A127A9B7_9MICC|nr:MFS transporter [Sinomonas atrocyanea]AMM34282.1 MFS transporter [Sinomonas atrocyanea]GEB65690.1 MFS transporter [Sinomonas atrocyanea]GGG79444.1 MFS transporter [Sinomonas atrocyanea]